MNNYQKTQSAEKQLRADVEKLSSQLRAVGSAPLSGLPLPDDCSKTQANDHLGAAPNHSFVRAHRQRNCVACGTNLRGLLEGTPDAQYNRRLTERLKATMAPTWGDRPTYMIEPTIRVTTEAGRSHPRLPEVVYHLWLESDPIGEACASSLIVLWFGSLQHEGAAAEILTPILNDVPVGRGRCRLQFLMITIGRMTAPTRRSWASRMTLVVHHVAVPFMVTINKWDRKRDVPTY